MSKAIERRPVSYTHLVGPPSLHYTGRRYEWEVAHHPDDMDPAALPEAWVLKLKADKPKKARTTDPGETIPEGRRNDTLTLSLIHI